MSVSYISRTLELKNDIENRKSLMLRFMIEDIYAKATPKTPLRSNGLRTSVLRNVLGNVGTIEWRVPYASVQEKGYRKTKTGKIVEFQHYTTPGTGAHYAENAVKEVMDDILTYADKAGLV